MKSFPLLLSFLFLIMTLPATSRAQNQEDERIVVSTNLVSVNVSVTDAQGRYVGGFSRNNFEVFDNQMLQQIAHFSNEEAPFSIGIIYDIHGPTAERTDGVLRALKQFMGMLRANDDLFFLGFNERGSLTVDFIPSAIQISNHLAAGGRGNPTSLYDAVHLATQRIRTARNAKKALLIISDGQDHNSRQSYRGLRNRLREFDVQLYAIGIADPEGDPSAGYGRWVFEDMTRQTGRRTFLQRADASFGRAVLDEMARASGGTAYFPELSNEIELLGICSQISLELRRQYTIGFYPRNTTSDQKWHRIRVSVNTPRKDGRLYLSYREGYQPLK